MTKRSPASDAGEVMIIGFDGTEMDSRLRSLLANVSPAGVILFARNIITPLQTHALVSACQQHAPSPLFRCVDLEGGTVDRFRKIIAPAPSQREVSGTDMPALFRRFGGLLGREARALGFNVDFAPVSDLGFPASAPVLESRTVSEDPEATIRYVRHFLRGLSEQKVLGCGKHFPGLGEGALDSHHDLPVIHKSWKRMWAEDLAPYRRLHRQFPFVMVAHAAYPDVTADHIPASISKRWLGDILRKRIGFKNLILADDLEMGGVLAAAPIGEAAVRAIDAGADMFLVCHLEENVQAAFEALVARAGHDAAFARKLRQAAQRVAGVKKRLRLSRSVGRPPSEASIDRLRREIALLRGQLERARTKAASGR